MLPASVSGPSARIKKTVAVETSKVLLKESGVNLTLTIVDTPGTDLIVIVYFWGQ
jgi:septin 7